LLAANEIGNESNPRRIMLGRHRKASDTTLERNCGMLFPGRVNGGITYFSDDDSPVSVEGYFDVSGSMSGDKIRRAREAPSKFVQTSHDSDEYFLIGFNNRAQLRLDKTRDGNTVLDKLTFVETKGQTTLTMQSILEWKRCSVAHIPKEPCWSLAMDRTIILATL
jgi:von Willebrand factor type A domain